MVKFYDETMEFPSNISYQISTLLQNYLMKNSLASLLEHDAL
jgi:hypothetical protein